MKFLLTSKFVQSLVQLKNTDCTQNKFPFIYDIIRAYFTDKMTADVGSLNAHFFIAFTHFCNLQ